MLDCKAMESHGLLQMPPMEPYMAAHLHPRQSMLSSHSSALPTKVDQFQSVLTEHCYRAAVMYARALKVLSLLTAYQAKLCGNFFLTTRCLVIYPPLQTCVSTSSAAPSRPQAKCLGLLCCRNMHGG